MELEEVDRDLTDLRKELRTSGVPTKLLQSVSTRALRSQRRQTGEFPSNRASRWRLDPRDPQYGTEIDCKTIEIRLLGMICEFVAPPDVSPRALEIVSKYLGGRPEPGTYRDALTLEKMSYAEFKEETTSSQHGKSHFHLGHEDPTISPKHVPHNISWRTERSNLIQGDMTLRESRTRLVELIGRYFQLGEVSIKPDDVDNKLGERSSDDS